MSEFSQLLSDHIRNKKITIYALGQYCDIDRSSIYKIMNGKRLPSNTATIEQISRFIHLTPSEHQELLEAYQRTLIGADNYYRRKDVMNFLSNFSENTKSIPIHYSISDFSEQLEEVSTLSNSFEVNQCVVSLMLKEAGTENGHIDLLIQPDFSPVIDFLSHIRQNADTLSVHHIICLNNAEHVALSKKDYNLHCLQNILPLCSCNYQYETFYYYDNISSHSNALLMFPYMILTGSHAILLSGDRQKGLVLKKQETLCFFRNIFEEYKTVAKPLLRRIRDPFSLLQYAGAILSESTCLDYSFQMIPCLSHLIPTSFLEKNLVDDCIDKSILIAMFEEHQTRLTQRHAQSKSVFLFSEDGIRTFLDTGRFVEYPKEIYKPFDKKDCIFLVRQMLDATKELQCKMLKKNIGSILYGANIFIGQTSGYLMFAEPETGELIFLNIEEPGLLFTFRDFFETMDDSLFYSDEEMTEHLSSLIEEATNS